jgi:hypothetical protein
MLVGNKHKGFIIGALQGSVRMRLMLPPVGLPVVFQQWLKALCAAVAIQTVLGGLGEHVAIILKALIPKDVVHLLPDGQQLVYEPLHFLELSRLIDFSTPAARPLPHRLLLLFNLTPPLFRLPFSLGHQCVIVGGNILADNQR